jgi:hypothetical protein
MSLRCLTLAIFLLLPLPAAAQSEVSSAETHAAQFVFVIDDSGSMEKTDPDRLAIFAVQSLVGMLDDQDEVSVVRLNGPGDGQAPPAIEPLGKNRAAIESLLALNGLLASYQGKSTRCRSALDATKGLLEAGYRPGVSQVLFFLTDGECTGNNEQPSVDRFLQGLRSHQAPQEGLFQFYLLRFKGAKTTPALEDLARRTDGEIIDVGGEDPTAILAPFARALSRSQGFESYLLTPRDPLLAAHRGAERVRILAIAPGSGPKLTLRPRDRNGASPQLSGRSKADIHRYKNGHVFRYAALDYQPSAEPVTVGVEGAGVGWKVVAVPEYRLRVRLSMHQGTCDQPGPATSSVDVGSTVCVVTELINAKDQVVGGEVTGGEISALVKIRQPGPAGVAETRLPANPLGAGLARFGLQRSNLARGDHVFEPSVTLKFSSGGEARFRHPARTLEVSSMTIDLDPPHLAFGALAPGETADKNVAFKGAFPEGKVRWELRDRARIPGCVSVGLGGVAEGGEQKLAAGQAHNVALSVAPYCGPRPFKQSFDTAVRLSLQTPKGIRIVELPLTFALDYRIQTPPALSFRVRDGKMRDVQLPVNGNFQGPVQLRAVLAKPGEEEMPWPEDRDDLVLGFAGGEKRVLRGKGGDPLLEHDFAAGAGAVPLRLRALPNRCCASGAYETKIGLAPAAGQPLPPGAAKLDPIIIPVRVEVEPAGVWACYGVRALWALALLLLLLLLLYIYNMFRNSSFLRAEDVAGRLQPLVWTGYGDTVEQKNTKAEILRLARNGLPLGGRAINWLRANPLRFGLPGGRYQETVELFLQPHRDLARSQISLVPERDLEKRLANEPEGFGGRLFATAAGGVSFLAVPDSGGRISRLVNQNGFIAGGTADAAKPRAVKLRRAKLLKRLEDWETYQEDTAAGWQVG